MNILFLTLLDFSSLDEKSIYTDLMREFVKMGHRVYIVSPTEKKKKQPTQLIHNGSYKILKPQIGNIQKTNIIEKGISTLTIESIFKNAIKKHFKDIKFDLVLYSTPPITLRKSIEYVKSRDRAGTYLLLKDIFPQNAVDLSMLPTTGPKGLLYRYFKKKEKNLYSISDYIGCMSQANVEYIIKHNSWIPKETVEVCPNSIEPSKDVFDENEINKVRLKYNIPSNKTLFIYGGNLGKPQGIDFLIECLKSNKGNAEAYFIIVGAGTEYYKLKKYFDDDKPENGMLLNQLPKDEYKALTAACHVGLIFLDRRFTIPNFPSRLLSYMDASMPVLAATDTNTDIGQVITEGEFGLWSESGDIASFNKNVQMICYENSRKQMGSRAKSYLEDHYTARHSYEIIIKHFSDNHGAHNV